MVQYINFYIKEFWYSVVSDKLAFISYLPAPPFLLLLKYRKPSIKGLIKFYLYDGLIDYIFYLRSANVADCRTDYMIKELTQRIINSLLSGKGCLINKLDNVWETAF